MSKAQSRAVISFTVIIVTSLLVAGALVLKPDEHAASSRQTVSRTANASTRSRSSSIPTSNTSSGSKSGSSSASTYKDGTYQASGQYYTPEGAESIGVSITLQNGTVSATSATNEAQGRESRFYNEDFIAAYSSYVVGKKLDDIQLGIVAGASLTPNGFNQALESIKQQAKA